MKLQKFNLTLLFLLMTILCFSQKNQNSNQGKLLGKVTTSEDGTPVEYATISVFDAKNNNLITGNTSDENGLFNIDLPFGKFIAKIEFITFLPQTIDTFSITSEKSIMNIGNVLLQNKNNTLTEVEVTAEKSRLKYGLDKKVFNLRKDILSEGGSVTTVLDNIPSVSVDPQGNVSLRGSQSVKLLIDGKPSALTSAKLLQNMSAEQVEKIEIITNPSAKYDAEGLSGIINIVIKKEVKTILGGSVHASVSYPQDYNLGLSLHRQKGKVNLFSNIGLRHWERPKEDFSNNKYTLPDTTFFTKINSEKIRRSYSGNINLGLDYSINDHNIITTSFLYDLARQPHDANTFYQDFDAFKNLAGNELRANYELEIEQSLEYLLSYERKFKKKGKKFNAFVKYIDNTENNDSDLSEFSTDTQGEPLNSETLKQRTSVDESDQNFIAQLDFVYPFHKKGKIELGAKGTIRNIKNNFLVEEQLNSDWLVKNGLSNDFIYDEKIYAMYLSLGNEKNSFSYQFGLRGELTNLKTELIQTAKVNDRKPFFDLFPSAHLGYKFKGGNAFQLSYSRRIQRPRFQDLNPFFSFTNDRNIVTGNPNLNPMYTHSFELGYVKQSDFIVVGSSIYYRHTNDLIGEIFNVDGEGTILTTSKNINFKKTLGVEFFAEKDIKSWLAIDGSFDYQQVKIDGSILNTNFLTDYETWTGRVGTKIKFSKKSILQLRYFYRAPSARIQGKLKSYSRFDVAFRKTILKGKGKISFSIYDLFFGYQLRYENVSSQLISTGVSKPWRPTGTLSFQYRW